MGLYGHIFNVHTQGCRRCGGSLIDFFESEPAWYCGDPAPREKKRRGRPRADAKPA